MAPNKKGVGVGIVIIIVLLSLVVGAFFFALFTGRLSQTNIISDTNLISLLDSPPPVPIGKACSLGIFPSTVTVGDTVIGTINEGPNASCQIFANFNGLGWALIFEGTTDANGVLTAPAIPGEAGNWVIVGACGLDTPDQCVTPHKSLTVLPLPTTPPPTTAPPVLPDVGDELDTSGASGGLSGLNKVWDVSPDLSDEPGPIILGVTISTSWSYVDENNAPFCELAIGGIPKVEWKFSDSSLPPPRWRREDISPIGLGEQVGPVSWDSSVPWKFEVFNSKPLPGCEINYEWELRTIVYGVLD